MVGIIQPATQKKPRNVNCGAFDFRTFRNYGTSVVSIF